MSKKSSDTRFSAAGYDPRFIVPSTKKNKVKVDERFSKKELQKLNVTATGKKAKVDRYGRRLSDSGNADYDKYFEEDVPRDSLGDEADVGRKASDGASDSESEVSESEVSQGDSKVGVVAPTGGSNTDGSLENDLDVGLKSDLDVGLKSDLDVGLKNDPGSNEFVDRARGEGLSDSDSDSDTEVEMESDIEIEEEKPQEGEPSAVFAVVNLDWDNVRAVDLMSTFSSFVPKGGNIKSVCIYPSNFGKEQMQKEEVEGPPKELFRKKKDVISDSDLDEELDLSNKDDLEKAARKLYTEDDGAEDYDSKALRRYQLQRLRYFYAVVVCDSVATAQNIYKSCDGSEFESTANIFDLRYVPEGMVFDDEPKDQCTKIPASYRPDSSFVTDALQHSKVKLTWDETPKERMTLSSRLFSQKEIDDMDFKAYLASDSEESDAVLQKDRYKSLLGGRFAGKDSDGDEDDVDMEITFNPGLSEHAPEAPKLEGKPGDETTIEAYRRKEKERRKKRAEKWAEHAAHEEPEKSEKSKAKSKARAKDKKVLAQDAGAKAELELLMMDDTDQKEHFNMKDIVKAEKKQRKKKKAHQDPVQDTFTPDLGDERFAEVFENHEFAIDPTNSEFKKTNTMKKILKERGERQKRDGPRHEPHLNKRSADNLLTSLVKKFKGNKSKRDHDT